MHASRLILTAALLLPALARPALAAWPHDPVTGNLPVCTTAGHQALPVILPDGSGGTFIAWQDGRADLGDVYVQHLSAAGVTLWTPEGVGACVASGTQSAAVMVADGVGGVIVAWHDARAGAADIYAQRLDASGTSRWTSNGVVVCDAANSQLTPSITTDGAGGAIIAWQDLRGGSSFDAYVQCVDSTGAARWTANGVVLSAALNAQYSTALVADGRGGAIVTWQDSRVLATDIYASRVDASGVPQSMADGLPVCTAAGQQAAPGMVSDGAGGAYIVWSDSRVGSVDIYAQWIDVAGNLRWTPDGVPVCTATSDQILPVMIPDAAGGILVAWSDYRGGADYDLYAQLLDITGTPRWAANGVALCTVGGGQIYPTMVADGAGGAIVAWQDFRLGISTCDIYAQRVGRGGTPQWTTNGIALCSAMGVQQFPRLSADEAGGAVAVWYDERSGADQDIYAQRVDRYGYLGLVEPTILSVRDVLNDEGGLVKVAWDASYLDLASDTNVAAYDVWRSVPSAAVAMRVVRGARQVSTLSEAYPEPGGALFAATGYAWEFVATQSAYHYVPAYSLVAATAGDSVADSNPTTAFMVVARNAVNTMFWPSQPDSGYSVDNLPPSTPGAFTGTYEAGQTMLQWSGSTSPDLAGYRLYRGGSAGFVPSAGNRILETTGTSHIDTPGSPCYYKLRAVDMHGNESPAVLLLPLGALAVDGAAPAMLSFSPPQPNPARGATTLGFALPHEAHVRLSIYDTAGRRVRVLVDGASTAGEHSASWDLSDDGGHLLGAGLYFATLEVDGARLTRRVLALR